MISFTFVLGILVAQGSGGLNLIAYRDALTVSTQSAASQVVPFAELWERGEKIRGQRIEVSGRVVRSFDAEASGELPARDDLHG